MYCLSGSRCAPLFQCQPLPPAANGADEEVNRTRRKDNKEDRRRAQEKKWEPLGPLGSLPGCLQKECAESLAAIAGCGAPGPPDRPTGSGPDSDKLLHRISTRSPGPACRSSCLETTRTERA